MEQKLHFVKMWEGANTYVFDIGPGSVLPLLHTVAKVSSYVDKNWMYFYDKGVGAAYYEQTGIINAGVAGLRDFLDTDFQKKYFQGCEKALLLAQDFVDEIFDISLSDITNDRLAHLIERGVDINTELFGFYLSCQPQYITGIESKVQGMLSERVLSHEVNEIFTLLSTPTKITTIRQEEIDWIGLILSSEENNSGEALKNAIRHHLRKYMTLHGADGGMVWDEGYLMTRFEQDKHITRDILLSQREDIKKALDVIVHAQKNSIEQYTLPASIADTCRLLADIGHLRLEMRIQGWMPVQTYLEFLAEEVAKRNAYNPKKIKFAQTSEVLDILRGNLISQEILEKRSQNFLITLLEGKMNIYSGEEAISVFGQLVDLEDHSEIQQIRGNIAMKGKVVGTAVVFRWTDNMQEKISQMGDDAILIAGQTRPQLMPLILRAKAIVTDEGGITSHAAIVSRELRIPCIVGTKNATKVFKDGDRIEVDAETGAITLISLSK